MPWNFHEGPWRRKIDENVDTCKHDRLNDWKVCARYCRRQIRKRADRDLHQRVHTNPSGYVKYKRIMEARQKINQVTPICVHEKKIH